MTVPIGIDSIANIQRYQCLMNMAQDLPYEITILPILPDDRDKEVRTVKMKPLNDRVIVTKIEEDEKTRGGIVIPDTAKEKPRQGKVMAVGPGKLNDSGKRIRPEVKENDRVLFDKYAGTEIKIDGVEHLIMREDDILAIVE